MMAHLERYPVWELDKPDTLCNGVERRWLVKRRVGHYVLLWLRHDYKDKQVAADCY